MATYPHSFTLVNPGFETGTATGWTAIVGASTAAIRNDPVYVHSGTYSAAAAANQADPWWGQTVDVDPDYYDDIDDGLVQGQASAWWTGYSGDSDNAALSLEALDASSNVLAVFLSPATDPAVSTQYFVTEWLPTGTRKLRIGWRGNRYTGSECSVYADDFELSLLKPGGYGKYPYINHNADVTGWVNVNGVIEGRLQSTVRGYDRDMVLNHGFTLDTAPLESYRDINLPPELADLIDAGFVKTQYSFLHSSYNPGTNNDIGWSYVVPLNNSSVEILDRKFYEQAPVAELQEGTLKKIDRFLPKGTRKIRVGLITTNYTGTEINADLAYLNVRVTYPEGETGEGLISEIVQESAGAGTNNVPNTPTPGTNWVNAGNITADDGSYATISSVNNTQVVPYLRASDFGFAIPNDAEIIGVEAVVQYNFSSSENGGAFRDTEVKLAWGASAANVSPDNKGANLGWGSAGDLNRTYGELGDMWGTSLTPSDINSSDFGLIIKVSSNSGTNRSYNVDVINIRVAYRVAGEIIVTTGKRRVVIIMG